LFTEEEFVLGKQSHDLLRNRLPQAPARVGPRRGDTLVDLRIDSLKLAFFIIVTRIRQGV